MNRKKQEIPETIELSGIGATRTVFLDGVMLRDLKNLAIEPPEFNWGYNSAGGPTLLSTWILQQYLPARKLQICKKYFTALIIAKIPSESFTVIIKIRQLIEDILAHYKDTEPYTMDPGTYMEVTRDGSKEKGLVFIGMKQNVF